MSMKEVTISGTVGKQVFSSTEQSRLKRITLTPSAANATVKIRDGNASGDTVFFGRATSSNGSVGFEINHFFDKGMHVKVIGTNAVAYLDIE